MFKKRKITKQSLEELAKVMPPLHECEMRLMVGGFEFRDLSGTLIKKVGSSEEVRYINPMDSSTMDAINNLQSESAGSTIGRSWDNIGSAAKVSIISNMINNSENGKYSKLKTQNVTFGNNDTELIMAVADGGSLVINSNQINDFTYADLQSILDHEEIHLIKNPSGTGFIVSRDEFNAYSGQVTNSTFQKTSKKFRVLTAKSWYENGNGGRTKRQIAELCGVSEWDF